jgi:uncharacterized protein
MILHKSIEIELKAVDGEGTFEGWAARFGNTDSQGDVIEPSAFTDAEGTEIPLLMGHKGDTVGIGTVENRAEGLWIKGKLLLATQAGREAYERAKAGIAKGLSVGFRLLDHARDGAVRRITRAQLVEVSLTPWPANPGALVASLKAAPGPLESLHRVLRPELYLRR